MDELITAGSDSLIIVMSIIVLNDPVIVLIIVIISDCVNDCNTNTLRDAPSARDTAILGILCSVHIIKKALVIIIDTMYNIMIIRFNDNCSPA